MTDRGTFVRTFALGLVVVAVFVILYVSATRDRTRFERITVEPGRSCLIDRHNGDAVVPDSCEKEDQ